MRRSRLRGSMVLTLTLATSAASVSGQQTGPPTIVDPAVRERKERALREGGLEAAAAVTGSYVGSWTQGIEDPPVSLGDLIAGESLLLTGRAVANFCELTANGRRVVTRYRVVVEAVLRGDRAMSEVSIVVPGGRFQFKDGTWAQINTPGLVRPVNRHEYLWVIEPAPKGLVVEDSSAVEQTYRPVAGPLGVIDLGSGPWVRTAGAFNTPLSRALENQRLSKAQFLAEIKRLLETR